MTRNSHFSSACRPRDAHPQVLELLVKGESPPEPWNVRRDLLSSARQQRHVVAEIEDDGSARLRFGDDAHGKRPAPGTVFLPRYRIDASSIPGAGKGVFLDQALPAGQIAVAPDAIPRVYRWDGAAGTYIPVAHFWGNASSRPNGWRSCFAPSSGPNSFAAQQRPVLRD